MKYDFQEADTRCVIWGSTYSWVLHFFPLQDVTYTKLLGAEQIYSEMQSSTTEHSSVMSMY